MCNDNTYGLMGSTMAARQLGVEPPCVMQNDYSLINRRIEENGLSEASAPWNENVGFLAYNTLAGGVLTGKYLDVPASPDDPNKARALANSIKKRGRMDETSWGRTLYRYGPLPLRCPTSLGSSHSHRSLRLFAATAQGLRRRRRRPMPR